MPRTLRDAARLFSTLPSTAKHFEDALPVQEAVLSMERRLGGSENDMLCSQGNLAITYEKLGRLESALEMKRTYTLVS